MERSRRAALFSVPPLWLIGVCLFLPTVRSCDHMESPAQLIRGGKWLFMSGMLAPFLLAELLAILIIVMLARGYVGKWIGRATLAVVVASAASPATLALCDATSQHLDEQAWALLGFAALIGAAVVLWRARAVTEFERQAHYLAAFALLNLPLATLLTRILVEDGRRNIGVGGWIYLGASITLAAIHLRRRRRRGMLAA
jgi:hypothetical protein